MEHTGLQLALDTAGSQSKLAEICGVSQPTVWGWLNKGRGKVPAEYLFVIERELKIAPQLVRPDLYPADTDAAA